MVGGPETSDMPGIDNEFIQTQCVLADGGDRFGVCALAFDQNEELLWMGNQGVSSIFFLRITIQSIIMKYVHCFDY